eukprot:UN09999
MYLEFHCFKMYVHIYMFELNVYTCSTKQESMRFIKENTVLVTKSGEKQMRMKIPREKSQNFLMICRTSF